MKKIVFITSLLILLAGCKGGDMSASIHDSSKNSTFDSQNDSTHDSGLGSEQITSPISSSTLEVEFSDAVNGQKYEKQHGNWVLNVSNNSYDGAIKLQYGVNSTSGNPNYILSPVNNFHNKIKVEMNCFATINDSVIVEDPFEFSVIGLSQKNDIIEKHSIVDVLDMPNPTVADSATKEFILNNEANDIKQVKIVLLTKLTSSNVGIKSIKITNNYLGR